MFPSDPDTDRAIKKRSTKAMAVALLLHGLLLLFSVLWTLGTPGRQEDGEVVSLSVIRNSQRSASPIVRTVRGRFTAIGSRVSEIPVAPSSGGEAVVPASIQSKAPARGDTVVSAGTPRLVTERELTSEQALKELLELLERHPEFRNLALREAIAGDGMTPGRLSLPDLRIEEMLEMENWKSSWEYELMKRGGGGYTGPYDPVYGFDRDKYTGLQVNILELLKLLKRLIGGAKD
jgi:hypothetical protein